MKFYLDKIRAAFGNTSTTERTHDDDDFTETIIKDIAYPAFAISQQNVMYADVAELGGYYYLKTIIVGAFKIKTKKGAALSIEGKNLELVLNSDMDEFESDYSNVYNRYITQVDFQLEEEDISKIDTLQIDTLFLTAKKHQINFTTIKD